MKQIAIKIIDAIDNFLIQMYPGLTKHMKKLIIILLLFTSCSTFRLSTYNSQPNYFNDKIVVNKINTMNQLRRRMDGYYSSRTNNIINDFLKSESGDLEVYIKEEIHRNLAIILIFIKNGNIELFTNNYELLTFENSEKVFKIIQKVDVHFDN